MVKSFVGRFRPWPVVAAFLASLVARAATWPAGELFGVVVPAAPPSAPAVRVRRPAPAVYEMRFMKLHAEGRFEEMWEMLAEDAQRAWGGIQHFVREMPRLDEWLEILEMQVAGETLLDTWTDHVHGRTYTNVARLVMRYRVRQQWREWTFDRQVHLVPAAGEWRTLCYPMRTGVAATR